MTDGPSKTKMVMLAMAAANAKTREAAADKKRKREESAPWKSLRDAWFDQVFITFEDKFKPEKWGDVERVLANKCLKEHDREDVEKQIRFFITKWCPKNNKFPRFKLFWSVRNEVEAEMNGVVMSEKMSKRERMDLDEYKAPSESKNTGSRIG